MQGLRKGPEEASRWNQTQTLSQRRLQLNREASRGYITGERAVSYHLLTYHVPDATRHLQGRLYWTL